MLYEPKKDSGKDAGSVWQLVYGKIQCKSYLPTVNMGLLGGNCLYIKKMDVLCKRWECKACWQIFTRDKNLIKHLKEERCTRRKTKMISLGGKFRHILNSSEKVFYGGDTKFSYTACQWIEAEAEKIGKHIHHKMCGQKLRYKDKCQIDWLIADNGWDTKYNLVSAWECKKSKPKNVWFEKEFTPYPHFIVYDFEAILAPLNEHPTEDLTYLSRHTPVSVTIHDTLRKDPVYLVDENPERLTERFIKVLTEKQEAIVVDVLKRHPYPSDFEMLLVEVQKQWNQWVNQVPVIGFNSGIYDINMVKKYFVKEISYNKEGECKMCLLRRRRMTIRF